MRTADSEELDQHWSEPAGRKPARPPISVVVGVISLVAAIWWIEALEPAMQPSLTVESQSFGGLLFGLALVVGTLLGVRIAWVITVIFTALPSALVISEAIQNPRAQTLGGFLLISTALVCLLLPSTTRFENRRLRLVLV